MPTVLSLHLGGSSVHAAVSVDGRIDVLSLGDGRADLPAPSPTDGPGLVRVLVTAQARCVRIVDAVPDELIVVRPDVGADDATLGEAAARARVPVPVVLDELRAVAALAAHGPAGVDRSLAPALGGLFWHRSGDAPTGPKPIVTREDLGVGASRPDRLPPAPSVVAVGPRTVFEEDAPRSGRRGGPPTPLLFVLAVLVAGAFAALMVLRVDDRPIAPPPSIVTTVVPSFPTSVPPVDASTTQPPVVDAATTSVPPVDASTTQPPAVDAPTSTVPHLGSVTLSGVGFTLDATTDSERLWAFGDDGEAALADLVTVMGQPIGDPGWGPDDRCTTPEVRRLGWGGLEVVLSRMAAGGPTLLAQWYLTGQDSDATSLWTLERIGIGSTVGDLRAAHGGQITLERPSDRDPAGWFDTEPLLGDGIRGAVGNTSDAGRVLLMWAGEGCQRRFG
ncbi:MAG: hypothetical protein MK182_08210 [Acidimicrobiales bacterium]|nr:hypothetical protein [Acidimicrobiales bacterium]